MTSADYSDWPIASADVCAKKCSQQNEFQCKSFEYCQSTKECLMFAGRTVGIPMSDSVTSCSYYTSKNCLSCAIMPLGLKWLGQGWGTPVLIS